MMKHNKTTICALASALGRGGIGVVRISGSLTPDIAMQILGFLPKPKYAQYGSFFDKNKVEIDKGIAIFYPQPHSFTGEDVLELQGHGGIQVMRNLLSATIDFGAVAAEAGEFSKRAFLNGKMDLLQAEAVADIIDAGSKKAALSALRSLSGEFSAKINNLTKALIALRTQIEASIDFADEEIDDLPSAKVQSKIEEILTKIQTILASAKQGAILREGLKIAIVGKPNAGKSSLLNALTQKPSAIITPIAGTTRDVLKETIDIDGLPLTVVDTAGLCQSSDAVEIEGIKRAEGEIKSADVILLVFDAQDKNADLSILPDNIDEKPILLIKNKIDLINEKPNQTGNMLCLSAKYTLGIDLLTQALSAIVGSAAVGEDVFLARNRHITALIAADASVKDAKIQLQNNAIELVAEDLRQAGQYLGSITGEFSSDDLLGEIFSTFCVGK